MPDVFVVQGADGSTYEIPHKRLEEFQKKPPSGRAEHQKPAGPMILFGTDGSVYEIPESRLHEFRKK